MSGGVQQAHKLLEVLPWGTGLNALPGPKEGHQGLGQITLGSRRLFTKHKTEILTESLGTSVNDTENALRC